MLTYKRTVYKIIKHINIPVRNYIFSFTTFPKRAPLKFEQKSIFTLLASHSFHQGKIEAG